MLRTESFLRSRSAPMLEAGGVKVLRRHDLGRLVGKARFLRQVSPMNSATTDGTCPNCLRTGFIHVQRVIRGGDAISVLHCSACDYEWELDICPDDSPSSGNSMNRTSAGNGILRAVSFNMKCSWSGFSSGSQARRRMAAFSGRILPV